MIEAAKSTNLIYRLPLEKQYESIQTAIKNNKENPPRIKKWFGLVNTDTIDYDKQSEIEEALKEQSYDLYVQISKAKKKLEADIKTIMEDSGRKYDAAHVSERLVIRDKKAISQQLHTAADNARLEANKFEREITAIKNVHGFDALATEWKLLQDPNWLPPDERAREAERKAAEERRRKEEEAKREEERKREAEREAARQEQQKRERNIKFNWQMFLDGANAPERTRNWQNATTAASFIQSAIDETKKANAKWIDQKLAEEVERHSEAIKKLADRYDKDIEKAKSRQRERDRGGWER